MKTLDRETLRCLGRVRELAAAAAAAAATPPPPPKSPGASRRRCDAGSAGCFTAREVDMLRSLPPKVADAVSRVCVKLASGLYDVPAGVRPRVPLRP